MRTPPTVTAVIKAQNIVVGTVMFKPDGSFVGNFTTPRLHEEFLSSMSLGELVTVQPWVKLAGNEEPCVHGPAPHFTSSSSPWCVAHRGPTCHVGLDGTPVCGISARTLGCNCCGEKS